MNLRFLFGLAAGYVLGTRDGRERYDQMVQTLRDSDVAGQAQKALSNLTGSASETAAADSDAHMVTPPVIVGPGPAGPGTAPDADVVLPDLQTSTAGTDDAGTPATSGERATRIDPPAGS